MHDFNCDGSETPQPSGGSDCFCMIGFACRGSFPSYTGSPPACGANVTFRNCGSGGCGACGSGPNTTEPMPCR